MSNKRSGARWLNKLLNLTIWWQWTTFFISAPRYLLHFYFFIIHNLSTIQLRCVSFTRPFCTGVQLYLGISKFVVSSVKQMNLCYVISSGFKLLYFLYSAFVSFQITYAILHRFPLCSSTFIIKLLNLGICSINQRATTTRLKVKAVTPKK